MNKTAIKNFAIWARRKLIGEITYRAGLLGVTESGVTQAEEPALGIQVISLGKAGQMEIAGSDIDMRAAFVAAVTEKARDTDYPTAFRYVIELVAYTWFNRLIAIRFMEVNGYLPSGVRVLSSENPAKLEPDFVTAPFDADLTFSVNERDRIAKLKDANKLDELFRMLFIKQCNALGDVLPGLFEKMEDYTELLLTLSFTDKDGVVYHLTHDIAEDDFNVSKEGQVEIIGWMYQYYNTEPKDEVFALLKKNVKITKERIPAATQLFTPDWIVRYMVENSLGRLWIESGVLRVESGELSEGERIAAEKAFAEKMDWKYYLPEAEQTPEVRAQLNAQHSKLQTGFNIEDVKTIDPCMGSGHILVYLFDVLMQIYETQGYTRRDAVRRIIQNNLYGLDIDGRAAQLAYFSVMMKALQYDSRFLSRKLADGKPDIQQPNVYAIRESNNLDRGMVDYFTRGDKKLKDDMDTLIREMRDAKEYGSILNVSQVDFEALYNRFDALWDEIVMYSTPLVEKLLPFVRVAEMLAQKYDVVVTNPPYMGTKGMNSQLSSFLKEIYPDSKADLFAAFIERSINLTKPYGQAALITQRTWLYISAFESLRRKLLSSATSTSFIELGAGAFEDLTGEVVQPVTFVIQNEGIHNYRSVYTDLSICDDKEQYFQYSCKKSIILELFSLLPSSAYAMKLSNNAIRAYINQTFISSIALPKKGLITSDNNRFLRLWFEVVIGRVQFDLHSIFEQRAEQPWVPHNKGGNFRRWYGNQEYIINWSENGKEIKTFAAKLYGSYSRQIMNEHFYFMPSISWSSISSSKIGVRAYPYGFTFDTAGPSLFIHNCHEYNSVFGLLGSCVAEYYIRATNPTINLLASDIASIPLYTQRNDIIEESVANYVQNCICMSRTDWDSFETSWDFQYHPLIKAESRMFRSWDHNGKILSREETPYTSFSHLVALAYTSWQSECEARFWQLKSNEEELNRIFIDTYCLQDELTPEVAEKDVTVYRVIDNPTDEQRSMRYVLTRRDVIVSLISYAVGCMFGRYSLDVDGLVLAGQPFSDEYVYSSVPVCGTGFSGGSSLNTVRGDCYLRNTRNSVGDLQICTFAPDEDNCIPITDEEYFSDDIVTRFVKFICVVYGEDTLEENLEFIAAALGNKGSTAREVIRNYFLNDFFKNHCKTYQKRPIYWLFDSGKQNGFKALVYMHRWNADTIGNVRVEYLHKTQKVYESEITRMQEIIDNSTVSREITAAQKRKDKLVKQLKETKDYDARIAHLALSRIDIDLDDGVKVNYEKVQTGREGQRIEILAKV